MSFKNDNIFFNLIKDEKLIGEFEVNKSKAFIITFTIYNEIDVNFTELNDQSLMHWHNRFGHFCQRDISKYLELHNITNK